VVNPVRRARIAVALTFAVHGAVTGTFATRIPWIADHLRTDVGGLGVALLFGSVGAITVMPFAGRFTHRVRARRLVPVLMVMWCLAVIVPALAPNVPAMCAAMFLYGATAGAADVAMNAQGVAVEQAAGRSIMSGLHGMWSLGGLIGSGVGVLAAHADLAAPLHFVLVGTALAIVAVAVSPGLLNAVSEADDAPAFALPSRPVLLIALVAFAAVFAEVASSDWAAVYLTDVAHAGPAVAAVAFSGFAATMAAVRLIGDKVVDRFGPVRTVQAGGVAATAGALVVALARTPALAIAGFALIGVGVAVVVPLAFTAAGDAGPRPGQQIAGVATIAYGAGMAAPASIGGIAQVSSLSTALYLVAALSALLILGAPTLRRGSGGPTTLASHPVPAALDR
jgi:MFS family permease